MSNWRADAFAAIVVGLSLASSVWFIWGAIRRMMSTRKAFDQWAKPPKP